jgi:putative transposase
VLEAVKVKLKLTTEQEAFCRMNGGACRKLYNDALNYLNQTYQQTGKLVSTNDLIKQIPNIKKLPEFSWLNECESTSLQQSLRHLGEAYSNFFNSVSGNRKGRRVGVPRFKSKHRDPYRFTSQSVNDNCYLMSSSLKIPKLGKVKVWNFKKHLVDRINGEAIRKITISQDSNRGWYASILIDRQKPLKSVYPKTGLTLGLDVGIRTSVTAYDSSGDINQISSPDLSRVKNKIEKLQKNLSKKQKGSQNFQKVKTKLSKEHFHAKNIRKDFNHKLTDFIVKTYDVITVETLNIQKMMKQHPIAGKIQDQAWYQFFTFLQYKSEKNDKKLIQVDPYFPSSKLCSQCKAKNDIGSLEYYICPVCGSIHNRDINAAKNLNQISLHYLNTGLSVTTEEAFLRL